MLKDAPIRKTAIAEPLAPATGIATRCRVTLYDALFLALAVAKVVPFVTADRRLCDRLRADPDLGRLAIHLDNLEPAGAGGRA